MIGFGLIFTLPQMYLERFCKIDLEVWGMKLTFVGVLPAVCLMLLMWIGVQDLVHGEARAKELVAALLAKKIEGEGLADGKGAREGDLTKDGQVKVGGGGAPPSAANDEF